MYNLIEELKEIAKVLDQNKLAYALCGGLAVGLYGESRATIDIDVVVHPEDLEKIIEVLAKKEFAKYSDPMPLEKGLMSIQRLLKFGEGEPEVLMLDLCMPDKKTHEEVWQGWIKMDVEGVDIWVVSKEGLIEMKRSRSSEKDVADIKALE